MSSMPAGPVFYAYGLCPLCLRALLFMPTGPRSIVLFLCAILTVLPHDMLSLLSLNIARHLDSYPNLFSFDSAQLAIGQIGLGP